MCHQSAYLYQCYLQYNNTSQWCQCILNVVHKVQYCLKWGFKNKTDKSSNIFLAVAMEKMLYLFVKY